MCVWGGGGGVGVRVDVNGAGEAFVKIRRKKIIFLGGGGRVRGGVRSGGGGGQVRGRLGESGWMGTEK